MNKTIKKGLSLVLIIIMVLSSVSMISFASNWLCAVEGHIWGEYVITKEGTCIVAGVETATCKRSGCEATNVRSIAVDQSAHKPISVPKIDATCIDYGYSAGTVCSLCGVVMSGLERIPFLGHSMGDWTYDYDNMIRYRKCIHCNVTVITEAIEPEVPAEPDEPQEETKDNFFLKIIDFIKAFFDLIASMFKR